jgi:hypothetical protein
MSNQIRIRLATVATVFTIAAIWILQNPYGGLEYNDASLYSFLALARLHPQSLPADVFLRFGSQDAYTIFGPLYAAAIRICGLEPAASILAFAAQVAFFICCWLFARNFMSARLALLAVGLLVALPSNYGAEHWFHYVENFLTPRQLSEAATLAALAASMTRRDAITAICLLTAILLHPIMATAGIVLLACLHIAIPRPRVAVVVAGGMALLFLVPILIIPSGVFAPFDPEWLKLSVSGASYLFMARWHAEDWAHLAAPIALLALGAATTSTPRVRNLCFAALLTATCSIAVNWIYVDLLHSVIFTRMQPWRWLWLVECVAVMLLPVVVRDCWRTDQSGRAGLVLLAATWVLSRSTADPYVASGCVALACLSALTVVWLKNTQSARSVMLGSWLLFICAILFNLSFKFQNVPLNPAGASNVPLLDPQTVRLWGGDGVLYAFALVIAWSFIARQASQIGTLLLCVAAAVACWIATPLAWQSWTDFQYTPALHTAFAAWRAAIPQQAEGVWPQNPMGAWYLLERPSYYSRHQIAGDIFSRQKAIEIHRRAGFVASVFQAASLEQTGLGKPAVKLPSSANGQGAPANADNLNEKGLALLCADPALDFYVSRVHLSLPPGAGAIVPNPLKPRSQLHLYRCADIRKGDG